MLSRTKGAPDPRPGNPQGRKAALLSFIGLCELHKFEQTLLPEAHTEGWPTSIDFDSLPSRIEALHGRLSNVILDKNSSVFWKETEERVSKDGIHKAMSIKGQYEHFDRKLPG